MRRALALLALMYPALMGGGWELDDEQMGWVRDE